MAIIGDLPPADLAEHASNVFMFAGGKHRTGARLIFHCLRLDPHQPLGLRCLSDFLDSDLLERGNKEKPRFEQFSAMVLEYALHASTPMDSGTRKELEELQFLSKWSWGFSKHKSGETNLDIE